MRTTLIVLAVTKMQTGVCIAGVRREDPAVWVRPVRAFGSILLGDITYPLSAPAAPAGTARRVMRPFDLAEMTLDRARAAPPFVEDWTCDFAHQRPVLLDAVGEAQRAAVLEAARCDPEAILTRLQRSLGVVDVERITATFRNDTYSGKYEARLAFAGLPAGMADAACTDLKWRAVGRRLVGTHPAVAVDTDGVRTLTLRDDELRAAIGGATRMWLALGLSREYHGRSWPLVVGVHTLPDYEADVDYSAL